MKNKQKIIIIDDEKTLLHTMAFTLKRKGYDVVIVEDGKNAHKKIIDSYKNDELYDLIITDIQIPGLSGIELIIKIREAKIKIPILAISGFGNMKMVVNLMRAGCNDYLDKPFSMNEFLDRISKLVN